MPFGIASPIKPDNRNKVRLPGIIDKNKQRRFQPLTGKNFKSVKDSSKKHFNTPKYNYRNLQQNKSIKLSNKHFRSSIY